MKGFIATLVSIMLGLLLLLYAISIREDVQAFEQTSNQFNALRHAALVFDAVAADMDRILDADIELHDNNDTVSLVLLGTLPPANSTDTLTAYQDFLADDFASRAHADISLNLSNLTDGAAELRFFDRYDLVFDYENETLLFLPGNSSLPARYDINITFNEVRSSQVMDIEESADGAGINLSLYYLDNNGSVTRDGIIDEERLNSLRITFASNYTFSLELGDGEDGEIRMETDAPATLAMGVDAPALAPPEPLSYAYEAELYYAQEGAWKRSRPARHGN